MTAAAQRAPWQNPRILTTLMLVFLAGAATGALVMQLGLHDLLHRPKPASAAPPVTAQPVTVKAGHPPGHDAVLTKFQTELALSGDQTAKLALVLDDYSQYYQSLQDQLDDLRATGKNRIMLILDPEQREKFEKMMNDLAPQLSNGGAANTTGK
jgi:hypothetical protein